jgi:ABC-type transporter Mla MlaB component
MSKKTSPASRVEKTETGLAFFGVIDFQSIPSLLEAMPEAGSPEMELDLSAATRIDSAGLAFLVYWGNQNLAPNQKISLRGASVQVLQLINIMRLTSVFELHT